MSDQMTNLAHDHEKHDHEYRIIVNTEEKIVQSDVITYDAVVLLAYPTPPAPNTKYSVTYEKAKEPHEGELVEGQSVKVKEGTEFDVTPTIKS